ncbi:zinc-dependent peptidase, partial [Pseudomonas fulva]
MWSFSAWRRKRTLARFPISVQQWQAVRERLPILDGIDDAEDQWLREASILFLNEKHLTCLSGVELDDEQRLVLAAQAQLPLLHLGDLNWYQGFHEIILYPDDFKSPQRHRDASGVEHAWDGEHSGEA